MQHEKPYEQVIRTNQEILDGLCKEMRIIAAYGNIAPALKKKLYAAEYWANYAQKCFGNIFGMLKMRYIFITCWASITPSLRAIGVGSPDLLLPSKGLL